jgi:Tfp pilus assembly protein PilX
LTISTRTAQERAEAGFKKKEKQLKEGQKALAEYEAHALAVREKMAKLKALRLDREAREGAQNPPTTNASTPVKRKRRP